MRSVSIGNEKAKISVKLFKHCLHLKTRCRFSKGLPR